MDLNKYIALTKTELVSTLLLFILITSVVLGSRLMRLTSGSALVFEKQTEIIFSGPADIGSLMTKLNRHQINVDAEELRWAASILGWNNFRRGRYELDGKYSYNGLLSKMAKGIQDPVSLVVLPGINPQKLSDYTGRKMNFSSQDFQTALTDSAFLEKKDLTREQLFGRMFPNTYLVYWTSTPEEVIQKILREFDKSVTTPLGPRAAELNINLNEALTMASIVEWEAKEKEEKPIISGLYWNRLEIGMRLQADPTVNYAIGERRRLLFEDYKLDHAFNTYLYGGLPPGPITNPSLSSIKAALYPQDHNYLYMVANPEGGHSFTQTFEEHHRESEKWRKWIQQQHRIKAQQEAEARELNSK